MLPLSLASSTSDKTLTSDTPVTQTPSQICLSSGLMKNGKSGKGCGCFGPKDGLTGTRGENGEETGGVDSFWALLV